MIDKFIKKRLEKEGLVTMPANWVDSVQKDMEQLRKDKESYRQAAKEITKAHNALLKDYAQYAPVKILKEDLSEVGVECHKSKEELIDVYYETFKVNYEVNRKDKKIKKED